MTNKKIESKLSAISYKFMEKEIPFCVIGAFALGFYGLPRDTFNINFLIDPDHWEETFEILGREGYICFQKTDISARFDSDFNIFGKIDLMFANSETSLEMLNRSAFLNSELFGNIYIIQPSDYIILKLLVIANNKQPRPKDEFDISEFFKVHKKSGFSDQFEKLDEKRIFYFAEKFKQTELINKYLVVR